MRANAAANWGQPCNLATFRNDVMSAGAGLRSVWKLSNTASVPVRDIFGGGFNYDGSWLHGGGDAKSRVQFPSLDIDGIECPTIRRRRQPLRYLVAILLIVVAGVAGYFSRELAAPKVFDASLPFPDLGYTPSGMSAWGLLRQVFGRHN
jgi:hypothetical protein